jgi:hypothetical protein
LGDRGGDHLEEEIDAVLVPSGDAEQAEDLVEGAVFVPVRGPRHGDVALELIPVPVEAAVLVGIDVLVVPPAVDDAGVWDVRPVRRFVSVPVEIVAIAGTVVVALVSGPALPPEVPEILSLVPRQSVPELVVFRSLGPAATLLVPVPVLRPPIPVLILPILLVHPVAVLVVLLLDLVAELVVLGLSTVMSRVLIVAVRTDVLVPFTSFFQEQLVLPTILEGHSRRRDDGVRRHATPVARQVIVDGSARAVRAKQLERVFGNRDCKPRWIKTRFLFLFLTYRIRAPPGVA